LWKDDAYRQKQSEIRKAQWQNPDYRSRVIASLRAAKDKTSEGEE
jgi:hypothetical protein